ncbi:Protein FANTASTIC FOUR 3 [Linum grandiflorum]
MPLSSQGLQSFLDPPSQAEPRVLRLRFATPDPEPDNAAGGGSGFSFLQCITENETVVKSESNYKDDQAVYVPPSMKRSASSLSKQSLEMCTESLGSETGTDEHCTIDVDEMMMISAAPSVGNWSERVEERRRTRRSSRNVVLPPPLSSIGRSGGVQMRSRREDGRLVLTAVSVCSGGANFQAERSDGRLRLRLTTTTTTTDYPTQEEEEEKAEEKTEKEEEKEEGEKVEMRGRCMETGDGKNRGLVNQWEQFWVAT